MTMKMKMNKGDSARKTITLCESCHERPATTHSTNPDWRGYELCAECAAEYDKRPPVESKIED